ncbi:hypothetical protein KTO58_02565 [Chitinophaga pendula]|uniref:DUF6786 family protein n=1 Tax=Chitinophaga TaxID=79328 RepID=UPI000BB05FE2|nr:MULTISPECIES: DUF6786 family protein [Chitinophaga]ASZ14273.1 hypothetical protein CK934_26655 [Chitinophaga sp. MD30]UCJ08082.1 hypothetical protein KTO58_02565 [Chitinophaga pendula]
MRNYTGKILALSLCYSLIACKQKPASSGNQQATLQAAAITFGGDVSFLKQHMDAIVLKDSTSKSAIVVVPAWQGRVMTSTATGDTGRSYGWINYDLVEDGQPQPHINAYGGEDRFWMGPEGGQYALFFAPGSPFDREHWQTPAPLDTEPFTVISQQKAAIVLQKKMQLTNYQGTVFNLQVDRTITLIARKDIPNYLGVDLHKSLKAVAYQSANVVTNTGHNTWDVAHGLPSIWILGMFPASPATTVIIPYKGKSQETGLVNDHYFGKVPKERLTINEKVILFKADATYRSKIGVKQHNSYNYMGSYDAVNHVLTIIQFTLPAKPLLYVNSAWEQQADPYHGDAVNAYNDGPPSDSVKPLGNFYEMESSSPAMRLTPGGHHDHYHRTFHITGAEKHLNTLSKYLFGSDLSSLIKH